MIQQYIHAGLVDEMHLHIAPVLLGAGMGLFDHNGSQKIKFETVHAAHSPLGTQRANA